MNGLSVVGGLSVCIQDRLLGFIIQHQVSVKSGIKILREHFQLKKKYSGAIRIQYC